MPTQGLSNPLDEAQHGRPVAAYVHTRTPKEAQLLEGALAVAGHPRGYTDPDLENAYHFLGGFTMRSQFADDDTYWKATWALQAQRLQPCPEKRSDALRLQVLSTARGNLEQQMVRIANERIRLKTAAFANRDAE